MFPSYPENVSVLASSLPFIFHPPRKGDVVVFKKGSKYFIKRIKEVSEDKYFLMGDNILDSLDSRNFGFIKRTEILGKVLVKI